MRGLISHPPDSSGTQVRLYDHLNDTGRRAAKIVLRLKPHLNLAIPAGDIARAAFITGITHDFGKAKRQFQDYIWGGKGKDKDHAAISSVFTFVVASHVFGQKPQPIRLLPFACAYAVNRHHGRLCNLEETFEEASIEHQIAVAKDTIDERLWCFEFHFEPLNLSINFADYRGQFEKTTAEEIVGCFKKFNDLLRKKANESDISESCLVDLYFTLLLVVSALTEADVACVIGADEPKSSAPLDSKGILDYASNQPRASETFQKLREQAWEEIQKAVKGANEPSFRLTLPTGLGKTLMGLYLSARIRQQKNESNPVVYALPYLSIIEQTTEVARSIFPQDGSDISVIQHHSLTFPSEQGEGVPNFERARFALENWDADLVVTTFDQLFYSFLSCDRSFIRRFFRLPGAVLILDEVQSIAARLIPALDIFLRKLQQRLGTNIIYMTATQPPFLRILSALAHDEELYFKPLERTRLRLELEPVNFSSYLSRLSNWLIQRKGKKLLLVANTVRSARDLFAHLRQLQEAEVEFRDLRLFHLSGSVVPVERLQRIRQIRQLTGSDPEAWVCVVSTQCVEAGIDLDMDEAVRDFAPWDSLLQVCGRVNRFWKRARADVWIYRWVDDTSDTQREFHSYIYDSVFTDATLAALHNRDVIDEKDYLAIQRSYVRELEGRLSTEASRHILHAALAWRFDELDFRKLFRGQERAWKVSVFCVADGTAARLKDIAVELWSSKNPQEALRLTVELCQSPLFQPLENFLRVQPNTIKQHAESLINLPQHKLKFSLVQLLRPMFQAYTITLPLRRLEDLQVNLIVEDFPYLSRDVYRTLNAFDPDSPAHSATPDWIV
jgi:CRISPR-associated endonuclease/helicase Cas3